MLNRDTLTRGFNEAVGRLFGRWRSASPDAAAAPASPEEEARRHLARGRSAVLAGNLGMAVEEFEQAVAKSPNWLEAIEAHAEALDRTGETARAAELYDRWRRLRAAIRGGPPDRGYVARHRGQFTSEVSSYGQVSQRIDKLVFPFIARGNALLAEGRYSEAIKHYGRALRLKPGLPGVLAVRAEALSAAGRFREAITGFGRVLASNRNDVEALSGRAIAQMALGKREAANADWSRQLALLPLVQAASRACVALRLADYATALPELEAALARQPGDPYWSLYRLTALRRLGRPDEMPGPVVSESWPGPLFALHSGHLDEAGVLARADTPARQAEAAFQLGVMAEPVDKEAAKAWWRQVIEQGPRDLIEYAAARNELARLGA